MSNISPDMYRGKKREVENYVNETNEFISTNWAMLSEGIIDKKKAQGNNLIGKIQMLIAGLDKGSCKADEYKELIAKLQDCIDKISNYWHGYGV